MRRRSIAGLLASLVLLNIAILIAGAVIVSHVAERQKLTAQAPAPTSLKLPVPVPD